MKHAHTVEHVRAAEQALMATLPAGTLMQRAAAGLAVGCARVMGGAYGARVAILVGSGDNGGDALYAGARLARRGARVDAILLSPDRAHPGGVVALRAAGGRVLPAGSDRAEREVAAADIVIDGIVGIGGQPGLREPAARLASVAEEAAGLVVAVDVPSGIDPDTGETPRSHVNADITVTFGTYKIGLLVDPGAAAAGLVERVGIGLDPWLPPPDVEVLEDHDVAGLLPRPAAESHKYSRGVLGVMAGSQSFTGAAVLAVGGAVHGGAGMVRYVGQAEPTALVRREWPEAVVGEGPVQAWVVGPGFGSDPARSSEVHKVLGAGVPVLVDADGLRHLPESFTGEVLLTPHAGELARLLGADHAEVAARRLHFARLAAHRLGATVLLKGSTTVVAAPDGRTRVNPTGTPWLATAGTGDVLSGLAGALLAGGLDPFDAGSVAAYVHGVAGQQAAGWAGAPNAQDVLAALPEAMWLLREPVTLPAGP